MGCTAIDLEALERCSMRPSVQTLVTAARRPRSRLLAELDARKRMISGMLFLSFVFHFLL